MTWQLDSILELDVVTYLSGRQRQNPLRAYDDAGGVP